MMIRTMSAQDIAAAAEVSDGVKIYTVLADFTCKKRFRVFEEDRKIETENYTCLEESVYSRFSGVFIALQKAINACNMIYTENILQEVESSKEFHDLGNKYTASNIFHYHGKEMIACAEYDFSSEIPSFMYTVSDTKLNDLEGYEALYLAVDSEYYPVLADLDNDLQKYIHGEKLS